MPIFARLTIVVLMLCSLPTRAEIAYDDAPLPAPVARPPAVLGFGSHQFRQNQRRKVNQWPIFTRWDVQIKAEKAFARALDANPRLVPRQVFETASSQWHGDRVCEYSLTALVLTPGKTSGVADQELGAFELTIFSPDGKIAGEYRVDRRELEVRQLDERTIQVVVTKDRRTEILADLRARMVNVDRLQLEIQPVGPVGVPSRGARLRLDRHSANQFFFDRGGWSFFRWLWPRHRPKKFRNLK